MIQITKIRINLFNGEKSSAVRAFVDIIIDDSFVVNGLVVIEGEDHTHYVNMPNRLRKNGQRQDVAHPITEECRRYIENAVLDEYEKVITAKMEEESNAEKGRQNTSKV